MIQRIITGLLIIAITVPPLVLGGVWLQLLVLAVVAIGSYEVVELLKVKGKWMLSTFVAFSTLIAYALPEEFYAIFLGFFVLFIFLLGMLNEEINIEVISYLLMMVLIISLAIRGINHVYQIDRLLMMYIFFACFGSDVGAYFVGVTVGKHKLLERVSPKKTWEGSIGGWITGAVSSFIFGIIFLELSQNVLIILSLTVPLIGQIGDLSFSLIKRTYNAKDFGNLFPGHGGVLDRVDSLLFCLMYVHVAFLLLEIGEVI